MSHPQVESCSVADSSRNGDPRPASSVSETSPSPTPAAKLRDALDELAQLKSRIADLQEQLTETLLALSPCPAAVGSDSTSLDADAVVEEQPAQPVAGSIAGTIDLQKWLLDREITIRSLGSETPLDEALDRLALQLGKHHSQLCDFYRALKRRIAGSPFPKFLNVRNYSAGEISHVVQFGQSLRRHGFLKDFRYIKQQRTIVFEPQYDGRVTSFLNGGWLERYVLQAATEQLRRLFPGRPIQTLCNPQVVLPDGQDFELDILIACDTVVLWLECKSGQNYPAYITKYGQIGRQFMRVDPRHCGIVLLEELTDEEKASNTQIAGMPVLNPTDIPEMISALRNGAAELQEPAASAVPPHTTSESKRRAQWIAALSREKIRPLDAAQRRQIIGGLLAQNSAAGEPLPLRDLAIRLQDDFQSRGIDVSKSRINDVTRALRRCGCCDAGTHPNYPSDVWYLQDDVTIDQAADGCAKLYLWSCLKSVGPICLTSRDGIELGRVIWGDQPSDQEIADRVLALGNELVRTEQGFQRDAGGHTYTHAQGEQLVD